MDSDMEAFAQLYRTHRPTVQAFLMRRTRHAALADDLTQEVFVRALRRIGSYTDRGKGPEAWLITIARNLFLDHCKLRHVQREIPSGDSWMLLDWPDDDDSVAAAETRHETLSSLRSAFAVLNPTQRRCIALRYLEELTTAEAAPLLGMTPGGVGVTSFKAIRKMRETVSDGDHC